MNKKYLLWICPAVAVIALASCNITELKELKCEPQEEFVKVRTEIVAEYADAGSDTRTVLGDNGKVFWKTDEYIGVTFGRNVMSFVSYNLENATTAMFVGEALISSGSNEGAEGSMPGYTYWGIYPLYYGQHDIDDSDDFDYFAGLDKIHERFDIYPTTDGRSVTTTLPNWQKAVEGSFDNSLFITLAKSDDYRKLSFYNVCGGVCFTVTEEGVKQVILSGNNNEPIAGKVKLVMDGNNHPMVEEYISPKTKVTISTANGECFVPGKMYYIVTLPVTFSKGYTLTFSKGDFVQTKKTCESSVTVYRSSFSRLPEADKSLIYKRVNPASNQIYYLTEGNKVENVDKVADNLAIVTNEYNDGYGVITCSGPITRIADNAFSGCGNITDVVLPTSVKELGEGAFRDTYNLRSIEMPGVETLGSYSFYGSGINEITIGNAVTSIPESCFYFSRIQKVNFPEGLNYIGDDAFRETPLTEITIPDGVTEIGSNAFFECGLLGKVQLPAQLRSIGTCAFENTAITEMVFPNQLVSIGDYGFSGCEKLSSVKFNDNLTTIGRMAFEDCYSLKEIRIPSNVKEIDFAAFGWCTSLTTATFESVLPGSSSGPEGYFRGYNENIFEECTSLQTIFVPSSVVKGYMDLFYRYQDIIVGVDTF